MTIKELNDAINFLEESLIDFKQKLVNFKHEQDKIKRYLKQKGIMPNKMGDTIKF